MKTVSRNIKMAYIAGLMDGDGSFSLIKSDRVPNRSPLYYPMIQLANANQSLVEMLKGEFGGSINIRKSYVAKDGSTRKISYGWKIDKSSSCIVLLEEVIPYLKLKQDRANALKDYILENPFKRGSVKLSPDILMKREQAYLNMRSFNDARCHDNKLSKKGRISTSKDPLFWAYLAGLMDTDGSFSIKCESRKSKTSMVYSPVILLSMIDFKSINYIHDHCTLGKMFLVKSKAATQGFCYRFGIYSKSHAIEFLKNIIPYLTVKLETAKTLLEYCENATNTKYCKMGTSVTELQYRDTLYQRMIDLNKYGVVKSPLIVLKPLPDNAGGNKVQASESCAA